jgi:sulfopyruvate decarboxylase subunit beta
VKRIEALRIADDVFGGHPLVITCGATARELASFSVRDSHLPLLDSMGSAAAVALGVARGRNGPVGVIEGDGSLLMGFSILPTLAAYGPPTLTVLLLDNGQHASAGGMPSQASTVDLGSAAAGLGLHVVRADTAGALAAGLGEAIASDRLTIVHCRIEPGNSPGIPWYLADPAVLGDRFRRSLAGGR